MQQDAAVVQPDIASSLYVIALSWAAHHAAILQLSRSTCVVGSYADQDSVRLLAVESCGAFAAALSKDDCSASLLPVVQKFAQVSQPH